MTDQEINIAISEACGWQDIYAVSNKLCGLPPHGYFKAGEMICHPNVPNYCNDLNAINEAVMSLSNTKFNKWSQELSLMITGTKHKAPTREFLCASPRQRAEAFLKTLNLWKS